MILDKKHEMQRKLFRQFAETEFTKEIQDELDETGDSTGICTRRWPVTASWVSRFPRSTAAPVPTA